MKVITMHSDGYQPLQDVTGPSRASYAQRWGFENVVRKHLEPVTCWQRPEIWLEELATTDWLLFMGTDAMITNQAIDVRKFCEGDADLVICADGNGINNDVFVMRNCAAVTTFLNRVLQLRGVCEQEQAAMNVALSLSGSYREYADKVGNLRIGGEPVTPVLLRHLERELNRSEVNVRLVPQRKLNAYPHELYGGTGKEDHSWQPGDFIAHLPGHTLRTRIKWFLATASPLP